MSLPMFILSMYLSINFWFGWKFVFFPPDLIDAVWGYIQMKKSIFLDILQI